MSITWILSGLREQAIESLSGSTLRALIPKFMTSNDGRVTARTSGLSGDPHAPENEAEIRVEMMQMHHSFLVALVAHGQILPARDVLASEHSIREADFVELARRSPIVPRGREILFGRALAHGFNLDFASSIHMLAPQIEHMVRYHLKAAGVTTSHVDEQGIETENGLSTLIELPEAKRIFDANLTSEIRALFCDSLGAEFQEQRCAWLTRRLPMLFSRRHLYLVVWCEAGVQHLLEFAGPSTSHKQSRRRGRTT